ncbi:protein FAM83H isoform X1 [Pungitius pungitius]|uniref:protein FAM83H isoform X1 n=1 Tax=Pungitius pungitius TaxID=134920 RepID=UPI002E1649DF
MARRSQCSSNGDNPLDPNYLPPHYREEYRLAVDHLIEEDLEGYYQFLQKADVVNFLSQPEIEYIQSSVQVPQPRHKPEQHFLEPGGDNSSDTYWPMHSDLDAPGLDLGWPQLHHFIGPTEVTTLVNPPEPEMPSIKEQARRLIKNAQQVIAIVMDMFTDVDMFADILDAAMRNVAVYLILDEQNAHHFVNMVSNCRVNLQNIQFLRVRTLSGITYHCRSGKSFKGQMMDRFLLTDCRAVLSGNYSFTWSFEKLHRCMAHLFLGQLVSTFDEEFRILFAQSQPLLIDNFTPMEEFGLSKTRQYPSDRILHREPKGFQMLDTAHPEERHRYDERMDVDWRMMPLRKQEPLHGPADVYSRLEKSRMDPPFDHGPTKMPMIENLAAKRHSFTEDAHGRFSHPFLQQRMLEPENKERQSQRGQQPGPGPGKEGDYSSYDKFWNQNFYTADQYVQPGLSQEVEPHDNFNLVHSYLLSTRNADYDQGSEELPPEANLPFGSPHPRRSNVGQPHACQTSHTSSSLTDQKQFLQESNADCKDPTVKRGLRNWRISSYLSGCENQDEGLPLTSPDASDAFEEPSKPVQQVHVSVPKREFKVPAMPRASQMPSYAKINVREQKLPDEPTAVATETKTTPTPSESSSTSEKIEEAEPKEPQTAVVRRGESFRRKYNAALPRGSRLRSSLIFSSMEQHNTSQDTKTALDQQDEESDKNEADQTKLTCVSQVFGQRKSKARDPFQWSRDMKSATFHNSASDLSKPENENSKDDDKDSSKDKKSEVQESLKPPAGEQVQPEKQLKPLFPTPPCVDMSDPDDRLRFFKELAAKRRAAKAAETEKSKEKAPMKPPTEFKNNAALKKEEPVPKDTTEKMAEGILDGNDTAEDSGTTASTEAHKSLSPSLDTDGANKQNHLVTADPNISHSCQQEQTRVSPPSETRELKNSQLAATMPVSAQTEETPSKPPQELHLSNAAVKQSSPIPPPTPPPMHNSPPNATPASGSSLAQVNDESERKGFDPTPKKSGSLSPGLVEESPSSKIAAFAAPLPPEEDTELSTSDPSGQSPFAGNTVQDSGSQINPSPSSSSCASLSFSAETKSLEDLSSTLTSSTLSLNAEASVCLSPPEASQVTSSETLSAAESAYVGDEVSPDECAGGSDLITSTSQSSEKIDTEQSCGPTPAKPVPESQNSSTNSSSKGDGEESLDIGSSKNVTSASPSPNLSPSSAELCLPNLSELESKSIDAQNDTITSTLSPGEPPPEHSAAKSSSPVPPDSPPNAAQSERQATPPSFLNLTTSVSPPPIDPESCSSPLTEFVGSVSSPEAEKTLTTLHSHSDSGGFSEQIATDSTETPMLPSTETSFSTEPTQPSKTPESVALEAHPLESPVSAECSHVDPPDPYEIKTDDTEATITVNKSTIEVSECSEKTNQLVGQNNCSEPAEVPSDEVVPASPQSKMPKSSHSRYQSSTANLLSSSNLRDDTKLLLEQISANSQSRIEAAKECPVTDDEKEDEADKNAKREKERGMRSLSRGQPKTSEQREKALEKIQTMRKERKVYSRFEMAP